MAIVLHQWIEVLFDKLLEIRIQDPELFLTALAVDSAEELVELLAEFEVVLFAFAGNAEVVLHDEVFAEFWDGEQALEAGIHVAVKGVVLETDYAIF